MIKNMISLKYIPVTFLFLGIFACTETFDRPELSRRPEMTVDINSDVVDLKVNGKSDTTIVVGAAKEFEAGSEVVYKIDISANSPLKMFSVASSSLNRSPESRVIRTIPEGALDGTGNFVKSLSSVTVFYKYLISLKDVPAAPVILTFTIYDEKFSSAVRTNKFITLRAGSTKGERLIVSRKYVLNTAYSYTNRTYYNLDYKPDQGSMVSLDDGVIYPIPNEVPDLSKIDVICISSNGAIMVSPSDPILKNTPALFNYYGFFYDSSNKLKTKSITKFKLLPTYDKLKFDQTSHSELFDKDLASMTQTNTPPLVPGNVVGFQRYDGSRGIFYVEGSSGASTANVYWFKFEKRR
jgi:hypothetical protein